MLNQTRRRPRRLSALRPVLLTGAALTLLAACNEPLDLDMRDLSGSNGLDTSQAAQNLPNRPRPDARGVISYPNYQVAVAQRGDTIASLAQRIGADAGELARYNGVSVDTQLRRDEIVALPRRVSESAMAAATSAPGAIQGGRVDVTTLASSAIDRAGPQTGTPIAAAPVLSPAPQSGGDPIRHQVRRGETAYQIARLYGVPVRNIAEWNGLGPDLAVREGQYLLIPQAGSTAPAPASSNQPGTASAPPAPPSAATALPAASPAPAAAAPAPAPAPAPQLATSTTSGNANAPLIYPVQGSIIRAYAKGRNEGIDIGAPSGTSVKAAAAGTVAAITKDTNGVAVVVIRHANSLLTVYTNLDNLTVEKGASVSQGQTIGKVKATNPSFLHFEVRQGLDSVDPTQFLP